MAGINYSIKSVAKALRILRAFTAERPEWGVTELSRLLGMHKSVVHRLLLTLEEGGFLQQDPITQQYRLGPAIAEVASAFFRALPLLREGTPVLQALVDRFGHSGGLTVLDQGEALYLAAAEGPAAIKVVVRVGGRRPAHAVASGKVLLASLPESDVRAVLRDRGMTGLTTNTITDPARLLRELDEVRTRGYAINDEESIVGMMAIAAPVHDFRGKVVAALSISFPKHIVRPEEVRRIIEQTVRSADQISARLGASAVESRRA